jgi:hypothetical protein
LTLNQQMKEISKWNTLCLVVEPKNMSSNDYL